MHPAIDPLPPLRFQRLAFEKVWGGRRLASFLGLDAGDARIGESWEVVDREEAQSVVRDGPYAGARLADLVARRRVEILGRARATPGGRFPLIVKYLDTAEPLSIQVHPSVGEARKSEAWYFVHAEPASRVWIGLAPEATPEAVARAAGTRSILPLVREWPARAGDAAFVRGGTVHAIGAGLTLLEVQENSDTTHRLYDWDRLRAGNAARPVRVEDALHATDFVARGDGPRAPAPHPVAGGARARLVECTSFVLDRVDVVGAQDDDTEDLATLWAIVEGRGRLFVANGSVGLAPGDVWLLPASTGRHRIEAVGGALVAVRTGTRP
jgi:mannose-6-phosphate isomerase